jgi:K+/H+ antiporter YhaU regulatory subunit KhtT
VWPTKNLDVDEPVMDLRDQDQVDAILSRAERREGQETAAACRDVIRDLVESGQHEVKLRSDVIGLARERSHRAELDRAMELSTEELISEVNYKD